MERRVDGKFKSSAPPGALTSGKDANGAGETRYEEPAESLTIPVASIKNGESKEVQTRGAGQGGGGTNDGAEKNASMFAAFKRQIREEYEERVNVQQRHIDGFQRCHVEDREDHRV